MLHVSKVLDLDGNAVLGYMLHFDVEGDSGIVARAYGTAVSIVAVSDLRREQHQDFGETGARRQGKIMDSQLTQSCFTQRT